MRLALIGAALAATAFASPALAQAVVENPGYCAQYYPDANCQNYGPGNPVGDPRGYYGSNWRNGNAVMIAPARPLRHHRVHRQSER